MGDGRDLRSCAPRSLGAGGRQEIQGEAERGAVFTRTLWPELKNQRVTCRQRCLRRLSLIQAFKTLFRKPRQHERRPETQGQGQLF
jgi:hypothetical protein